MAIVKAAQPFMRAHNPKPGLLEDTDRGHVLWGNARLERPYPVRLAPFHQALQQFTSYPRPRTAALLMLLTAAMPTIEASRYGGLQPQSFYLRYCAIAT